MLRKVTDILSKNRSPIDSAQLVLSVSDLRKTRTHASTPKSYTRSEKATYADVARQIIMISYAVSRTLCASALPHTRTASGARPYTWFHASLHTALGSRPWFRVSPRSWPAVMGRKSRADMSKEDWFKCFKDVRTAADYTSSFNRAFLACDGIRKGADVSMAIGKLTTGD